MSLFQFSENQLLAFFVVLVRVSSLVVVLPFLGNPFVPPLVKILFSLVLTVAIFPALINAHVISLSQVQTWASEPVQLILTIAQEVLVGLVLGFIAKLVFDAIVFGSNMIGNFMGFAAASMFDPHHETQSQVVSEFQMALAMILFLAVDAHHMMLHAAINSFNIVGVGQASIGGALIEKLIQNTAYVIQFGLQMSAPIALVLFSVNVIFGVMSKALPQLNVLVLSLGVSALLGFLAMLISFSEMQASVREVFLKMNDWMTEGLRALSTHGR